MVLLTPVVFSLLVGANRERDHGKMDSAEARISDVEFKGEARQALNSPAELKFIYGKRKGFRNSAAHTSDLVSVLGVRATARELTNKIALPFDIKVVFEECGSPDSFYDEDTRSINICYELIDAYDEVFWRSLKAAPAREEAAKGAVVSMFLHEVAHALIAGWNLPITGREEDVADQFSTLLLINGMPDGEKLAMDGARSFRLLADMERGLEKDYSDPHSLDEQRFFNTICLVYGHRPEHYEYLIKNGSLPVERAFDCEEDFARVNKAWQKLLAPYLVQPIHGSSNSAR